jgi:hypothetical protein
MFPRSYNFSNGGPKWPVDGAWHEFIELSVSPIGTTKSPKLQKPSSFFAIHEVLPKIHDAIDVDPDEVLPKILDFIVVDLDEIVELSNSQSYPQVDPLGKKQKFGVDGIGKKPCKKSYDSNIKF